MASPRRRRGAATRKIRSRRSSWRRESRLEGRMRMTGRVITAMAALFLSAAVDPAISATGKSTGQRLSETLDPVGSAKKKIVEAHELLLTQRPLDVSHFYT